MSFLQSIILGIIQGLTEFLPVSSSAHLVLVPYILDWRLPESQVFPFDVLVQIGTLLAVIVYFWKDLWSIIRAFIQALIRRKPFETREARMGWYLILATIPAGLAGVFLKDSVEAAFNNPRITAIFLMVTALFLLAAEFFSRRSRKLEEMTWLDALIAGIFQALSIFPGISRSGSTITGGMLRHLERSAAARFAFLMSIPVMLAAGIFSLPDLLEVPDLGSFIPVLLVGFIAAAVVGYLSIHWLLSFVNKRSLVYFAAYCVLLASVVLIISNIRPATPASAVDLSVETVDEPALTLQTSVPLTDVVQMNPGIANNWLLPVTAECAAGIPGLALVTTSINDTAHTETITNIDFQWGNPENLQSYAATLVEDHLVFIVNPQNTINKVPVARLNDILDGSLKTWGDLADSCPNCFEGQLEAELLTSPIQLLIFPSGTDLRAALESHFSIPTQTLNTAVVIPSISAMNEAVLTNPAALGFLPALSADPQVALVNLTESGEPYLPSLPLLALAAEEPDGYIREWLACVQQQITP